MKNEFFADVQRDEERVDPQYDQHLGRGAGHEAGAGGYRQVDFLLHCRLPKPLRRKCNLSS